MAAKRPKKTPPAPQAADEPRLPTSVNMPLGLLDLLQEAARARSRRIRNENLKLPKEQRTSARPSASQIIVELLERHRDEIEAIARGEDG
jgi:hypothetical protein